MLGQTMDNLMDMTLFFKTQVFSHSMFFNKKNIIVRNSLKRNTETSTRSTEKVDGEEQFA